ncbi:MAG: TetR/AcrR family transcriptional regulator [Pseudomonadota bacterium]
MARPREFDIEKACEDAMNVFWEGSYEGSSLPDLLTGLKLSRGSLYKAFGSKKGLFIEALSLYDQSILQPGVALLKNPAEGNGRDRIRTFFSFALLRVEKGDRRGCLLCNAAVGAAHNDGEIGEVVKRMLSDLTAGFDAALADTSRFSGIAADERSAKAAHVTMSYVGLRVLARSGAAIEDLQMAVKAMIDEI